MAKSSPKWQAHNAANYDSSMTVRCSALLDKIISDIATRRSILVDPRDLHRDLFAGFVPPDHRDYAGTYRGTPNAALADRRIFAESQLQAQGQYEFCLPGEVPDRMSVLLKNTHALLNNANANDYGKLIGLAYTFCWFGKIHPFLDGNGHIQRAVFAVMATDFGYPLSRRFAIHPRPYDRLLALALELFTRAPEGKENEELGLVTEYLAFFLDGPFNGLRKHLGTATPYV